MIEHIVLLKWKPGVTEEQVLQACGEARLLLDEIDDVERITVGRDRAESDHRFTHALIVQLADEPALRRYLEHPARARYIAEHLKPLEDQRIEIDVPVDLALDRESATGWYWGVGMGGLPPDE